MLSFIDQRIHVNYALYIQKVKKLFFRSRGIDRALLDCHGSFLKGFGKSRMTVDGAGDIFGTGAELNSQHAFGDHVRRPGSDDMHPKDPVGFFVGDDFDKPFGFTHTAGSAGAGERIGAGAKVDVTFFGLFFGESHRGHFGPGVDHRGNGIVVHFAGLAGDTFGCCDPFGGGFMGQHRTGD